MIKLKINNVPGYKAGDIIKIETDAEKVPLSKFWRNRLRDSSTDGCVEIVKSKGVKK